MTSSLPHPLIIGLGGSIGSGKSVVREAFEVLSGWETVDSDKEAKELYFLPEVRRKLRDRLNFDPITGTGSLDKGTLRAALSDPAKRMTLEEIVHGTLFDRIRDRAAGSSAPAMLVESAILFSSGLARLCHRTIAVLAAGEVRRSRAEVRDADKGEAFFRMMDERQKKERQLLQGADYVIDNDGAQSLILQIESITSKIFSV